MQPAPPDVVRCTAECAPGKRVQVVTRDGTWNLPHVPVPVVVPPHPLEVVATQLLEHDERTRAHVATVADTAGVLRATLAEVTEGQVRIAEGIRSLAATMAAPVEPVYNAQGKLIGAQRCVTKI